MTKELTVIEPAALGEVLDLDSIASRIRAEWGKGIETQFRIGHLLREARSMFGVEGPGHGDDRAFGVWFAEQSFPFSSHTALRLRQAAENEEAVRALIAEGPPVRKTYEPSVTGAVQRLLEAPDGEPGPRPRPTEVVEDIGFGRLRSGIYHLLGWEVGDDGFGGPTKNGLIALPEDQLVEMKRLVTALAAAFGEAVQARRQAAA